MILRSFFQDILRTKLLSLPSYPACTGTSVTTRLRLSTSVPRPVFAPKYCSFINVDPHHYQSTMWLTPSYSTSHIPPTAHVHMCILFLFVCLLLLSVITAAVFNHGRRSVGGQEDMSPYFLKWRGRPVFCPPYFFGSRHCLWCTALITYIAVFVCLFLFTTRFCFYSIP